MKRNKSKRAQIIKLLDAKQSPNEVAKQIGCGVAYVYSVRHSERIKTTFRPPSIIAKHWAEPKQSDTVTISVAEHEMLIKNASRGDAYESVRSRNEELEAQYAMCEEQLHHEQCKVFDLKAIVKYLEEKLNAKTKG
jgi:hypothetical protein